jgi:hypothetical protein
MFVACEEKPYRHFQAMFEDKNLSLRDVQNMGKFIEAALKLGVCRRFNRGDKVYVDAVKNDLSCVRTDGETSCFWVVTRTVR